MYAVFRMKQVSYPSFHGVSCSLAVELVNICDLQRLFKFFKTERLIQRQGFHKYAQIAVFFQHNPHKLK